MAMIVDSDAGTDPDDTCVAILVGRHRALFGATLLVSNDETSSFAKGRFLQHVMNLVGADIPVAAGLPSNKRRDRDTASDAGLVPALDVARDAVEQIERVLDENESVEYVGLGALTNLAAVLARRPELASRVRLTQMGPAIAGNFERGSAQYNARVDPAAFRAVLRAVPCPTLIATHTTWGAPPSRPPLGVYPDDEIGSMLRGRPDLELYGKHLAAFVASGKDCSILHDPTTLLVTREPELVETVECDVGIDDQGWLHLTRGAREAIDCPYITTTATREDDPIRVRLSLGADYGRIRRRVRELLG